MHIADKLLHLQKAGHPQYVEWHESFVCNSVTENELQELNQQMKNDLNYWRVQISSLRKTLHSLNFFTCLQLLRISNEFYCLINNPNHEVSHEILLLLMSLSPDLTAKDIKKVTSTAEAQSIALKSLPSLTPSDHNKSVSFYVVDEADVPGEIEKLSETKKEIYSSMQEYEFPPRLVLAAIHQCGPNEEEVSEWCFKNAKLFENTSIITEDSVSAEHTPEIDISNTTVQELVDLEFPEPLSIEAVKTCGEDLEKCLEYCTKSTAEHANFSDDKHDEMSKNISVEADSSHEAEPKDTSLSEYVI